jgi:FkbM family methyltransferase
MSKQSLIKTGLKQIYKAAPFKKQVFSCIRRIAVPGKSVTSHLYFKGVFKVKCGKRYFKIKHYGAQVENTVFWYGLENGFEKDSVKLWMKLCSISSVIFDIGANTGLYSLIAKTLNPNARVFAFEPIKRIGDKLKYNIALNNYDINVVEKAVSNNNGTAIIYDYDIEHVYSATLNENFTFSQRGSVETKVETITLDKFIEVNNLPGVDLIKIDVETHEPEVLEGFSKYLRLYKPAILIEILNNEVGNRTYELVKDLGYLYFNINEDGDIKQQDVITKSEHFNFLFCSADTARALELIPEN